MRRKTIYRIEDEDGEGPYRDPTEWGGDRHNLDWTHPTLYSDNVLMQKAGYYFAVRNYKFGFARQEHLFNWFSNGELFKLEELGYNIAVYESRLYVYSPYQAIFDPDKSRLKKTYRIRTFLARKPRLMAV